jgi:superfamily II DNA/RNA helicase
MTWSQMGLTEELVHSLEDLKMDKPSIIQAASIPKILANRDQDFLFQATNGSGKTLSFAIPAIMAVDPELDAVQVIILANTRELIRQVQAVVEIVCKNTNVTSCIGDTASSDKLAHIVVTVPKWLENRVTGRKSMDISNIKMMAYDEADEIFLQEYNHKIITTINSIFKK